MNQNVNLAQAMELELAGACHTTPSEASPDQLHAALSKAVMARIAADWKESRRLHETSRRACYFSAEFLVGRAIYNNLLCLGLTREAGELLESRGASLDLLEEVEDAALGNGGLGRLAACFLDSAATMNLPLDGYGIRYQYGLFRQEIKDGFQVERVDDWTRGGDPWSLRREGEAVTVSFADCQVRAIPYDMPILGYNTRHVSTLRLWQAEPMEPFDFDLFNGQDYDKAVEKKNRAEDISRVLYPNDSTPQGKKLRLRQQYFFCSASLQDILRSYKGTHSGGYSHFPAFTAIQLNDTHPVVSIPELIRQLMEEGLSFEKAWDISRETFSYTNHTIMAEALEKWDMELMEEVLPEIAAIIVKIDALQQKEFAALKVEKKTAASMAIIQKGTIHMAYLAIFGSRYVNGVAQLHTDILIKDLLKDWYALYPQRFQNKTNGVTQRRWLALANPQLSNLITELLGSSGWMTELSLLKGLEQYADDEGVLRRFMEVKAAQHRELAGYLARRSGISLEPHTIFDVQIKRLHEYKRQFLNILSILELYFEIKEGSLQDFAPTTFLFGAKSAPGYLRAKGIIKLISEVGRLIAADTKVSPILKVVFVPNYNVSAAERLVAAADVSVQISTAGTEASGTGNMKLMMNGAVTLGTYDGANVEIVAQAGRENNYIFGATVEELAALGKSYDPKACYKRDKRVARVLDALVDGTLDDGGTGIFQELYDSILKGAEWHKPDAYYLLLDFPRLMDARLTLNRDYRDSLAFARKCWLNISNSGMFSSDRTIAEYAKDIWHIERIM